MATREGYCVESYSRFDCGAETGPLIIFGSLFYQGGNCADRAAMCFVLHGCAAGIGVDLHMSGLPSIVWASLSPEGVITQ